LAVHEDLAGLDKGLVGILGAQGIWDTLDIAGNLDISGSGDSLDSADNLGIQDKDTPEEWEGSDGL
jgi:hypothetical protein